MEAEDLWGCLYLRLGERFKTSLDYGGGSRDAQNLRYISEVGATELTDGGRQRREGDQRGLRVLD